MELRTCLERLCGAPGAAGLTGAAETAAAMLKEYIEDVRVDALGSVMGIRRCGLDGAPLLLLEAHIDEIGFVVTRVDDDGFVYTEACGGGAGRRQAARNRFSWHRHRAGRPACPPAAPPRHPRYLRGGIHRSRRGTGVLQGARRPGGRGCGTVVPGAAQGRPACLRPGGGLLRAGGARNQRGGNGGVRPRPRCGAGCGCQFRPYSRARRR